MARKFDVMWQAAAADFSRQTGKSIQKSPPTTLDDCLIAIRQSQQISATEEPEEDTRLEKFKNGGLCVIECLKVFGGIASQAADMVVRLLKGQSYSTTTN